MQYLRYIIFATILGIIASCKPDKVTEIPPSVLSPDTMVNLMTQMHLAESAIMLNRPGDDRSERNVLLIKNVLNEFDVDSVRYRKSFEFYTSQPELFAEIYEGVLDELARMQAEERIKQQVDTIP